MTTATGSVTPVEIDVKLDIWDTAGAERYHSIAPMYYRNARAAVVVYDISDAQTFERAKKWVSNLREKIDLDAVIAMVGNKADLGEEVSRETSVSRFVTTTDPLICCSLDASGFAGPRSCFRRGIGPSGLL